MKKIGKFIIDNSFLRSVLVWIARCYLLFVYKTSKWDIAYKDSKIEGMLQQKKGAIIAFWHNQIAFSMHSLRDIEDLHPLISSHRDGRIISEIVLSVRKSSSASVEVISGSTNKDPSKALRIIIQHLKQDRKIIITPDGPRGPVYQINSAINQLAHKYHVPIITIGSACSKYIELSSWDKMIIPLPFGKMSVIFELIEDLSGDVKEDNILLANKMSDLTQEASKKLGGV